MKINDIPEELFDLLAVKNFKELSSQEKEIIEQLMTTQEYEDLHQTIKDFKQVDSEMMVRSDRFNPVKEDPSFWYRVLNYKIPVYKVAASFLIFAGLLFTLNHLNTEQTAEGTVEHRTIGVPVSGENYPADLVFEL